VLAKLPREDLHSRMHQIPIERFQWPLGLSIFFLALEPLVGERRRRRVLEAEPREAMAEARAAQAQSGRHTGDCSRHRSGTGCERVPARRRAGVSRGKFKQSADEYGRALAHSPNDVKLQYNLGGRGLQER